jgi:hypothetical protein
MNSVELEWVTLKDAVDYIERGWVVVAFAGNWRLMKRTLKDNTP